MLKVISKWCWATSWNVAEAHYKPLSKSLWHDASLVRHTISLLNVSNAKCAELATREVDTVPQITASISRMLLGTSLCLKHWPKAILSKLVIYSNLPNSIGKKLERLGGVHGYLSWWLRISLWQRGRTQIASDYARGDYS